MKLFKIILNIYYEPVKELIDILNKYDFLIPINGGSTLENKLNQINLNNNNIILDNTYDNISYMNHRYGVNEYTSIYWIWKNYEKIDNPEYIGFNHYRRFFKYDDCKDFYNYDILIPKTINFEKYILLVKKLKTLNLRINIFNIYGIFHKIEDFNVLLNFLKNNDKYSDFIKIFLIYILNSKMVAPYNMFLMKKELFFEWCEFIFPIIFYLKDNINLNDGRDDYQKRAISFLVERIFGAWIIFKLQKTNLKIKFLDIIFYKQFKNNNEDERTNINVC